MHTCILCVNMYVLYITMYLIFLVSISHLMTQDATPHSLETCQKRGNKGMYNMDCGLLSHNHALVTAIINPPFQRGDRLYTIRFWPPRTLATMVHTFQLCKCSNCIIIRKIKWSIVYCSQSSRIGIFTRLKLCLADAIHNFKWVKIHKYNNRTLFVSCQQHLKTRFCYSNKVVSFTMVIATHWMYL